jgi:LPS export ABC transporter protein LptC
MNKKKIIIVFFLSLVLLVIYFGNFYKKKLISKNETSNIENIENIESSNLLSELNFSSKDDKGNEYSLFAKEGEIDFENNNIIFLKQIKAIIKLKNSEEILISSDFGKYNTENSDTIFSKNVLILYLNNRVNSDYLEFSINKNLMTISKDVSLSTNEYTINADVIEMDINTRKVEIFMLEGLKKVKIKSIK